MTLRQAQGERTWTEHDGGVASPVSPETRVVIQNDKATGLGRQLECEAWLVKWKNVSRWRLA